MKYSDILRNRVQIYYLEILYAFFISPTGQLRLRIIKKLKQPVSRFSKQGTCKKYVS